MQNPNRINVEDLRVYQIIDANLDRAREGLRVLEDWARFGLGGNSFVAKIKNYRQILGKNHLEIYKQSRNYIEDQCKGLTHQEQNNRKTPEQIISSNSGRVQEALRVIEEFSRLHNQELSKIASEIRYEIYTLEIDLLNLSKSKWSEKTLKENDPRAIVVLLGDHGPALTKNCNELRNFKISTIDKYDIQDRYGAFLAIHEPDDLDFKRDNLQIIQNIFPSILKNITNNSELFNELETERKFFDRFNNRVGGVNVLDGIIVGGKDDGKPLFEERFYKIKE